MRHRLVAPRGLHPCGVALTDGTVLYVGPDGVIEVEDRVVVPGFPAWDPGDNPDVMTNPRHVHELLQLGFQHAPATGSAAERPAGRFAGEFWYCTETHRPLWWDGAAWRDALGRIV